MNEIDRYKQYVKETLDKYRKLTETMKKESKRIKGESTGKESGKAKRS